MTKAYSFILPFLIALLAFGCGDDDAGVPDAMLGDATLVDASAGDSAAADATVDGTVGSMDGQAPDAGRDTRCDEGPLVCDGLPPMCGEGEVAAIRDGCWQCVNAITCAPWGEPGCGTDVDCSPREYCNSCATGSCFGCEDCVAGCVPHGCESEDAVTCRMLRPDCGPSGVAVARTEGEGGSCWVCVNRMTCEPITRER